MAKAIIQYQNASRLIASLLATYLYRHSLQVEIEQADSEALGWLQIRVQPEEMRTLVNHFFANPRRWQLLDDYFTDLYSLVIASRPDADYQGLRDEAALEAMIQDTITQFADDEQIIVKKEFSVIQQLIEQNQHRAARVYLTESMNIVINLQDDTYDYQQWIMATASW